jgi:hypothetical protein
VRAREEDEPMRRRGLAWPSVMTYTNRGLRHDVSAGCASRRPEESMIYGRVSHLSEEPGVKRAHTAQLCGDRPNLSLNWTKSNPPLGRSSTYSQHAHNFFSKCFFESYSSTLTFLLTRSQPQRQNQRDHAHPVGASKGRIVLISSPVEARCPRYFSNRQCSAIASQGVRSIRAGAFCHPM